MPHPKQQLMLLITLELHSLGVNPSLLDPDKVMWAFLKGIRYHDALARGQREHPENLGKIAKGTDDMDQTFEAWHRAMAEALNQKDDDARPN